MSLSRYLNNMRVGFRINLIPACVILCAALVAATTYTADRKIKKSNIAQDMFVQLATLSQGLEIEAMKLNSAQAAFLRDRDERYIDEYYKSEKIMTEYLSEMQRLSADSHIAEQVEALVAALPKQHDQFIRVADSYVRIGLDETLGYRGKLRAAVHAVEEILKKAAALDLKVEMLMMRRHEKDFMLRGGKKYIDRMKATKDKFLDLLHKANMPTKYKNKVSSLLDEYIGYFNKYAREVIVADGEVKKFDELFRNIIPISVALLEESHKKRESSFNSMQSAQSQYKKITIFISVGAIVALLILAVFIARSISRPVSALTAAMNQVASGEIDVEVPSVDSRDEIGDMARALDVFKGNMAAQKEVERQRDIDREKAECEKKAAMADLASGFEAAIGASVSGLSETADQLQDFSSRLSGFADQSAEQSSAVESASSDASRQTQSVASAVEELSASIRDISQSIGRSCEISDQAMSASYTARERILSMSEAAQRIGEVVGLINDIAEQTNLLALNATIEAARAGTAGRGFAVVASEVKQLAEQTARATAQIGDQISQVQGTTEEAVSAIEAVTEVVQNINDIGASIAAATSEQNSAVDEVARSIHEATARVGDVNNNIVKVSSAAQQTGQAASDVQTASEDVSQQSVKLRAEVDKFLDGVRAS